MTDSNHTTQKNDQTENENILGLAWRLCRLAMPIALSLGVSASISLVDSVLVAPLGAPALAAIALGGNVSLVIVATLYGLLTIYGIRVAEADAAGDLSRARTEFGSGMALSALTGLAGAAVMGLCWPLLFLAGQPEEVLSGMGPFWLYSSIAVVPMTLAMGYRMALEAVGRVWLVTGLTLLTVALNGVIGFVLIHGHLGLPAMGLTGAGLASLLANVFGLLATVAASRWGPEATNAMRRARFQWAMMIAQARAGFAAGLQYLLETGASMMAMLMVGTFGTAALAANQIVSSVALTIYMMPLGVAVAAGLFVARLRGEGRVDLLRPAILSALVIVTAIMGVAAIAFWLLGETIAGLFSDDPLVIATAASLFIVFAFMQLFDGIQSVSIGALRGFHDVVRPAVITTLGLWFLGLPAGAALGYWLVSGPEGVWSGIMLALCVVSILLMRRLWRLSGTGPKS